MAKIIYVKDRIPKILDNVSCIGYFDGVHIGHQELIKKTVKLSKKLGLTATLICFKPDPIDLIENKKHKHILTFENQLQTIEYFGIEQIIIINFNKELMKMSPKKFIEEYLNRFNIKHLVFGYDFSFGYKGKGTYLDLDKYAEFNYTIVDKKTYLNEKVSSTRIKEAISRGNFKLVNKLLGYDYYLEAKVVKCSKMAEKWLVECKNANTTVLLPPDSEYSDTFFIKNRHIYIIGTYKLKVDTRILLSFENE